MAAYRISEVATRSGFSPSTLRYYEDIGLLSPARTEAGYRLYDDQAVEWLRFVARAKELGLSLEEIGALTPLWDGDGCTPAAAELRSLVGAKLTEARHRIQDLVAFVARLQRVHADLQAPADEDACGSDCVCLTAGSPAGPAYCTLSPEELRQRTGEWSDLLALAASREAVEGGVRAVFTPDQDVLARAAALAAAEQTCCANFEFSLHGDAAGTTLTVSWP